MLRANSFGFFETRGLSLLDAKRSEGADARRETVREGKISMSNSCTASRRSTQEEGCRLASEDVLFAIGRQRQI